MVVVLLITHTPKPNEVSADSLDTSTHVEVTAQEEYEAQLEWVRQQHEVEQEEVVTTFMDRLQHSEHHTTFNHNLPNIIDYNLGGKWLDDIANYIFHKTKNLPHPTLGRIGTELVKTWSMENDRFWLATEWQAGEMWICQLTYSNHADFIDSQEFWDYHNQVDYCVDVYLDRYLVKRHSGRSLTSVWAAWPKRTWADTRILFN